MNRRADTLRKGGQRAVSIDLIAELLIESPNSPGLGRMTGEELASTLTLLGFTPREREWLLANRLGRVSRTQAPGRLGWSARMVDTVRKAAQRRIERIQAYEPNHNDLRASIEREMERIYGGGCVGAYRETLSTGHKVWALWPSSPLYPEIIFAERQNIFAQKCPQRAVLVPVSRDPFLMTMQKLEEALAEERKKLERIEEKISAANRVGNQLFTQLASARAAADDEAVDAELGDRTPNKTLSQAVGALKTKLDAVDRQCEILSLAKARQIEAVEQAQAAVDANRWNAFQDELSEPNRKLQVAMDAFLTECLTVSAVLHKHGMIPRSREVLWPSENPADQLHNIAERLARGAVYKAALHLADQQYRYGKRAAAA